MPELPEVELYTRYFAQHALRQPIARVHVRDSRILGDVRDAAFVAALRGRTFREVRRHGKHLFADAGTTWLHLHFGMTGDLAYYRGAAEQPRFARVVFDFRNGAHLAYDDMRLFGVVDLADSPDEFIAAHRLGVDALAMTLPQFRKLAAKKRGAAKALLMTQEAIAGVGNLYADEALYQAAIDPRRNVDRLDADDVARLFRTLRKILRETIERKAHDRDYPPRYLVHRRETGAECPICGGSIRRATVFGRTTYFCSKHQR